VAFRPVPWLSLGFGLDIVPATFEVSQALNFGSAEGNVHASGSATGVGGNAGLYIRVVPRWLDFAFTYRSAVELNFTGHAALTIPPELAALAASYQNAKTTVTLPHSFTFALGSHLLPNLSFDVDVHLVMWESFKTLSLTLTDPNAMAGAMPTVQSQPLNFHIATGVRFGFEYRVLDNKLRLRIGGGWDQSPAPPSTLGPLGPDTNRGLIGGGIGYHFEVLGIDVGYLAVILSPQTATNPAFRAKYESLGHVVALGITLHFEEFGGRINEPDYKK
jgi:long-chain fatty acid transport protein